MAIRDLFRVPYEALRNVFSTPDDGRVVVTVSANAPAATAASAAAVRLARELASLSGDSKTRQTDTQRKLAVYNNDLRDQVERRLKLAFHPENYVRMLWVMHLSTNIMRRVLADTCCLYENPAERKLLDASDNTLKEPAELQIGAPANTRPPSDGQSAGDANQPAPPKPGSPKPDAGGAGSSGGGTPDLKTGDVDVDQLADVLELSGSKQPQEETPFDKLMDVYDWDVLLDTVEKLAAICPCVWVRPLVTYELDQNGVEDATTGKLNYVIYTSDVADVVIDPQDKTRALAFYYYGQEFFEGKLRKVVHFWTTHFYFKFDMEWKDLQPAQPNPLGRLPVTPFKLHLGVNSYFNDGIGDDLYEATIELCLLKTLQNSRFKDSSFKQLAIQGDPKSIPADIVMGGPSPVILGDENQAQVLDLQPQLDQMTVMWEKRELSLASAHGINAAEYKNDSTPQSGFAKKLDRDKILKESRRRRKFFAKGEQDLYTLTSMVLAESPVPEVPALDPAAKLKTDFAEPTFEEDPRTQASVDALGLEANTLSVLDILKRENPDLTDVELIKMMYRNKRINEVFMTTQQDSLEKLLADSATLKPAKGTGGGFGGGGGMPSGGGPP